MWHFERTDFYVCEIWCSLIEFKVSAGPWWRYVLERPSLLFIESHFLLSLLIQAPNENFKSIAQGGGEEVKTQFQAFVISTICIFLFHICCYIRSLTSTTHQLWSPIKQLFSTSDVKQSQVLSSSPEEDVKFYLKLPGSSDSGWALNKAVVTVFRDRISEQRWSVASVTNCCKLQVMWTSWHWLHTDVWDKFMLFY